MASRFEAEKFTGKNDFALWRMKMRAMLIQQGLSDALSTGGGKSDEKEEKEAADEKEVAKKAEVIAKAHSAVVLCLGDKVLREVAKETTAAGILEKLEGLYLTKSLANRLLMKQRLYSYKFQEDKGILEQLEDFGKVVDDLENIDVTIGDEDKAILLLNALPKSYDHLRDAIMYGREGTITLLEVQSALRAKEQQKGNAKGQEPISESLTIKKFKSKKSFKKDHEGPKGTSKDSKETRSCHWCKKPGHLKRDCYAWKRKQAEEASQGKNSSDCVQEAEASHILNVMEEMEQSSWILDSGCRDGLNPYPRPLGQWCWGTTRSVKLKQ